MARRHGHNFDYLKVKEMIDSSIYKRSYFAREIGISERTLGSILSGQKPGHRTIRDLARILGCPLESLLCDSKGEAS
jgi:transcriptional regulator with XRE-family HTH domain